MIVSKYVCLAIALLFAIASPVTAVDYYVDASRSSSGDGSAASPWKEWSDINWTTITSALESDNATIYFSSRDTWTNGNYAITSTGSSSHRLRLYADAKYNTVDSGAASWQTETDSSRRGKFQQTGGSGIVVESDHSYITIKGFYVDHPAYGGINLGTSNPTTNLHHILVENCVVDTPTYNHGIWFGYAETGCTDIIIRNNTIMNTQLEGIYAGHYSYLSDTITGVIIEGNTLLDCGLGVQGDIDVKPGCYGAIVRNNTHYRTLGETDGSSCGVVVAADNAQVYNNIFYRMAQDDGGDWGFGIYMTADGDGEGTGKTITAGLIYNNLIYSNASAGIRIMATRSGHPISGVRVLNNTLTGNNTYGLEVSASDTTITLAEVANNIMSGNTNYDISVTTGVTLTSCDYNLYYRPSGNSWRHQSAEKTWVQWKALGFDTHGVVSDPQFVSATNFGLQAGSPAINAGKNESSYFTTDITGNTRSGTWDIGAYEYSPTYYVDYTSGYDTNSGASTSSPWKHCPGDSNATDNASITLSPGDTIVFKGGVPYYGQINSNASGTSGSRITYISGHRHSSAWPDSSTRAIVDGASSRQFGFHIAHEYLTIDGLEIRNIGAPTGDAAGIGIENGNYLTVQYCRIHDVNESASYTIGYGIENGHASYNVYAYNEIYNVPDKCIETWGGTTYGAQDANFNTIHHNYCHDSGVHGLVLSSASNRVYDNIFSNIQNKATFPSPGYAIKVDEGGNNTIYNNLIINANAGLGVLIGYSNRFYNNTLYGIGNNDGGEHGSNDEACIAMYNNGHTGLSGHQMENNEFINNICHYVVGIDGETNQKYIYIENDAGTGNLIKNNSFYGIAGDTMSTASRVRVYNGTNNYYSLTQLEANFNTYEGGSGNVASGNIAGNQLLAGGTLGSLTDLPTGWTSDYSTPNASGLSIGVASPTKDVGLSESGYFTTDILGATRSTSWDIGAYEYIPIYYVDFDDGNDTRVGTSRTTAWKNLPGTCTLASSSSASCSYPTNTWATIQAGDTIKIKSGTSHASADGGRIHIASDFYTEGDGNITIERDTTWGTGSVTIDGDSITLPGGGWGLVHIRRLGNVKISGVAGASNAYDGIIIQNSQYDGISTHPGNSTQYGPVYFDHIKFLNNGSAYASTENASDGDLRIYHHTGGSASYIEMDGGLNRMQGVSLGESGARVQNFSVSNCIAYDHNGTDDGGIGFKAQNSEVTFTNCTSYSNYKGFDLGENDGNTTWDINYKVVNSTAYSNTYGINFSLRGLEGSWSGDVNFYIINSIVRDNTDIGSKVYAGPYNLYVIHSVYDNNGINLAVNRDGLSDNNTINAYLYNNVFYKPSNTDGGGNVSHLYWTDTSDPMTVHSDYNSYIQNASEYFKRIGYYGGGSDAYDIAYGSNGPGHTSGTWYDWKSWHNDSHSVGTGCTDTTAPPFTDVSAHNYTLTAHYAGANLSTQPWYIYEMGLDRIGNTRSSWDIGAYEYGSSPDPGTPTTGSANVGLSFSGGMSLR